jgi:hypothetical protein
LAVLVVASAATAATGITYAATAGNGGAKACVTSGGLLALPKSNGSCPSGDSATVLGATGPAGTNGTGILSGSAAPSIHQGVTGDYYIDTATHFLYGPAVRDCPPYPCSGTRWGKGISLVGPAGAPAPADSGGVAYQATGFANMPNGQAEDVVSVPIPVAGDYLITAVLGLQHKGNDNTSWNCYLRLDNPDGTSQNEAGGAETVNGQAGTFATIPIVAGVSVKAGAKAVVSCDENEAQKGDSAGGSIIATQEATIGGVFNP